jgi:hypothetical protein
MTVKIEIHPARRAAAFGASQHAAVERTRLVQIGYRKRKMKQWLRHEIDSLARR